MVEMATRPIAHAFLALACAAPGASMAAGKADDAGYPNRPIRIVVGATPGGMPDITARLIGPKLVDTLRQQVVVDNRPGAGVVVATRIAAAAAPDGHTLLSVSAAHVVSPTIHAKLGYDPVRDFSAITMTANAAYLLVVAPSLGVSTLKDLIALAKSKPGQLNFASGGMGSGTHFAGEVLKHASNIDVVHVPYRGIPDALTDTIAGRVHLFMAPIASSITLSREGKLRALGVSTHERIRAHSDIPTLAEAGLPGFRWDSWSGLLAPANTPRPIIDKLNREITAILKLPDVQQRFVSLGAEPSPTTPAYFDKLIAEQVVVAANLARQAGIK